jgi:hypothetical protein
MIIQKSYFVLDVNLDVDIEARGNVRFQRIILWHLS